MRFGVVVQAEAKNLYLEAANARLEAELASLQAQLDACRKVLAHELCAYARA